MDWIKDNKGAGAWAFIKQPNKWGYLNNPRWMTTQSEPVNYDGRESEEPQIWDDSNVPFSKVGADEHIPCGHWHTPQGSGGGGGNGGETEYDYLYIALIDYSLTPYQWRIVKLNKSDGAIVWDQSQQLLYLGNPTYAFPSTPIVDSTGVYSCGYCLDYDETNYGEWRVEKRDLITGALLWEKYSTFSSTYNQAVSITSDDTYLYIGGIYTNDISLLNRVKLEKRNKTTGDIVSSTDSDILSAQFYFINISQDKTLLLTSELVSGLNPPGSIECMIRTKQNNWTTIDEYETYADVTQLWSIFQEDTGIYYCGKSAVVQGSPITSWRIEKRALDLTTIWTIDDINTTYSTLGYGAKNIKFYDDKLYVFGETGHTGTINIASVGIYNPTDGSTILAPTKIASTARTQQAKGMVVDSTGIYVIFRNTSGATKVQKLGLTDLSLGWETSFVSQDCGAWHSISFGA